jgi:hypothetical protein
MADVDPALRQEILRGGPKNCSDTTLANAHGAAIVAARADQPFASINDL